jgi:hypothetical protein
MLELGTGVKSNPWETCLKALTISNLKRHNLVNVSSLKTCNQRCQLFASASVFTHTAQVGVFLPVLTTTNCLFFFCRLKINHHIMRLQMYAFLLELGVATNRNQAKLPG